MAWGRGVLAEGRDGILGRRDVSTQGPDDFVRDSDFRQEDITYSIVATLHFVQNGYKLRGVSILIEIIRKNRYFW